MEVQHRALDGSVRRQCLTQLQLTTFAGTGPSQGAMDAWVRDYEDAKQLADDTLALIQARTQPSHV